MPDTRRPQSSRRPAARPGRRTRPAPPAVRPSRTAGLTTRAAILGLVVCALVVSAALPLREYLAQRGAIDRLAAQQADQRNRIAALQLARQELMDPAYVADLARQRLHFVRPGETAYILIAPSAAPVPVGSAGATAPVGPEAPWYSQLWGSVRSADRPVPVRRPAAK